MKAEDIIKALVLRLPNLTDQFCDRIPVDTITSTDRVATATVAAGHGRVDNELVTITDAVSPILIDTISRTGTVATVTTLTNHDFTFSDREIAKGLEQEVILSGSAEAEFNGTFNLIAVYDRLTFTVEIEDSGPNDATGAPILENGSNPFAQYNTSANITVLNATQFTYPILQEIPLAATGAPILNSGHRITGAVSIDRFMDAYTKHKKDQWWCVVILGDVIASKGRQNRTDSTDQFSDGQHYQQSITQPFGVYLIAPTSHTVAARPQRDEMEDIVPLIMKSVLLAQFPTGFAVSKQNRATFTAHGFFLYNGPVYIHEITFEQNADLLFVDSVGNDPHVAFRDIDLTMNMDLGETTLSTSIDLDVGIPDVDTPILGLSQIPLYSFDLQQTYSAPLNRSLPEFNTARFV